MNESGVELSDQDRASWSAVEHLVRLFRLRSGDEPALVSAVCDEAVRLIDPARHAGVILAVGRRNLEIIATSGPVPRQLDELQQQEGAGPCQSSKHATIKTGRPRASARTVGPRLRSRRRRTDRARRH